MPPVPPPPPPPGFEPVEEVSSDANFEVPVTTQDHPDIQNEEASIAESLLALEGPAADFEEWDESDDIEDSLNAISSPAKDQPTPISESKASIRGGLHTRGQTTCHIK
ncbi:MAG: hypothetical protein ACJZ5P_01800 [Candidatus Thalassarchaeaceae archaeon]